MSGLETARRIRRHDEGIRVVILSMHSTQEYREAAAAIGVDAYVVKDELVPDLQIALRRLTMAPGRQERRP